MEKLRMKWRMNAGLRTAVVMLLVMAFTCADQLSAQPRVKKYTVHDGQMQIELSKRLSEASLDSFITQFNLFELALKEFIRNDFQDSLRKAGWKLMVNSADMIVLTKPLFGFDNFHNPEDKILFTGREPSLATRFPVVSQGVKFGENHFKNNNAFAQDDSSITFFLPGYRDARQVVLSGSFVDWSPEKLKMNPTATGWELNLKLKPGKYWYKFIVDGRWMIDENNELRENDGMGNMNSIVYKTNYEFRFTPPGDPKKVFLSGSFNDWDRRELEMKKANGEWRLPLYLADGTHTYRFIVGNDWYVDPMNPEKLPNEFNHFNSVIRFGKPYKFQLNEYMNAREVYLSGSFNGWRKDELQMHRTSIGWEIDYTLGPGNYYYKYIVDGAELKDNPGLLIIEPNYTFRLKGRKNAKEVFLAGDFNNWEPGTLLMKKDGDDWILTVHLSPGKHLYKFIVDGNWIRDPDNELWEENRFGTGDSVIWFEK